VENVEIARTLEDIADLLELQDANPFRIRAYRNAARTVEAHTTPLRKLVAEGADLTELQGIGKDIAGYIKELVETGELALLDELGKEVPRSLIDLTRIPGLGAKRVRVLWEELGIETLSELERAAKDDSIKRLKGFGAKTQERILAGIAGVRRRGTRFKLSDADQYVGPLVEYMQDEGAVRTIEVAGSYRRRKETVGDIDLLVIAKDPGPVVKRFTTYPEVRKVELAGDTKATVILASGLQVDLRILPRKSYGAALQYFTGSKEHNVKLRKRAVERGLRISEYGVFQVGKGKSSEEGDERDPWAGTLVAGRKEEEVYQAVDLPWIPAELREDWGEIEAAERDELPTLLALEDIRGDLQMHTTWSDGYASVEEMLDACVAQGYQYFAITDHSKALAMTGGLDEKKLLEQWHEMDEIVSRRNDITLLRSMEVDILLDGRLDLDDESLAALDIVLVSVHSKFDLAPGKQTKRILKALEHPDVNILGHPTGRLINKRDPMDFDLDEVLQCAAEYGVAVELNAHPDRLDLKDTHLMKARELGVKIVIGTDAHRPEDLGLMRYGVDQARRAWLEKNHVLNTLPLGRLLTALKRADAR
jgi:DNA polymerase (family 10)